MFVPIRPRDRRILLLELLFMWDIFRGAGRGGCPNDGGLRRLSRLGGGVGQEVQHATGALGAALLVDGADAPPRRRAALRRGAALLRRRRPRRYFPRVRHRRQARPRQSIHVAPQVRVDLARRLVRAQERRLPFELHYSGLSRRGLFSKAIGLGLYTCTICMYIHTHPYIYIY